jgi:hypothetical protein
MPVSIICAWRAEARYRAAIAWSAKERTALHHFAGDEAGLAWGAAGLGGAAARFGRVMPFREPVGHRESMRSSAKRRRMTEGCGNHQQPIHATSQACDLSCEPNAPSLGSSLDASQQHFKQTLSSSRAPCAAQSRVAAVQASPPLAAPRVARGPDLSGRSAGRAALARPAAPGSAACRSPGCRPAP